MVAWIGRGGTTAWPPRSPDLTPLDFSVWDTLKKTFLFHLLEELWARITEAFATIDTEMIQRILDEILLVA
jgi:hypothetical protein